MNLFKARLLQLHNLQLKVSPTAAGIEADPAGETLCLDPLHVVDKAVAVLPGLLTLTAQGLGYHILQVIC